MGKQGNILLKLGEKLVPHGQELRVANFDSSAPSPQMMIRYQGHRPDVMLVDNTGEVVRKFKLNTSPNNTGMEVIARLCFTALKWWYTLERGWKCICRP